MAEIKSTIDLVMERTKNMGLTEEEKNRPESKKPKNEPKAWPWPWKNTGWTPKTCSKPWPIPMSRIKTP
jgi:hypothetical protein